MLFCPKCGTINMDEAKFCENCGTKLDASTIVHTEQPSDQEQQPERMPFENFEWAPSDSENRSAEIRETEPEEKEILRPSQQKKQREQSNQEHQITIKKPDIKKIKIHTRKLTKIQKIVIGEVVCLCAVIIAFLAVGSSQTSAEKTVKKYFTAYAEKDWEKVYQLTDFPEGDFIGKEQYIKMMEQSKLPEITNYDIQKNESGETAQRGLRQSFHVEYSVKGQEVSSKSITAVRQSEKSMLFFDTWKVLESGMIAENFSIYVPAGAQIAVDEIKVSEDHKAQSDREGMDCYRISVFNGTHKIRISAPWYEEYEEEFDSELTGELAVSGMTLTDKGEAALEAKMQEALEKYYQNAAAGEGFRKVKGLFAENSDYMDDNEAIYEELKENLKSDDYTAVGQIQFDNFRSSFSNGEYEADALRGTLSFDYSIDYTYRYSGGQLQQENSAGTSDMSAQFVYDGDTYKLLSVYMNPIWYR